MMRKLDAKVVAIDQSERMVELTQARGVEAHVGDVQELGFAEGEFDCAVAAWMLFHPAGVFPDAAAAQSYVDSWVVLSGTIPDVEGPIRTRRTPCAFVADK
jgi:SAM-dependent methyltransferase